MLTICTNVYQFVLILHATLQAGFNHKQFGARYAFDGSFSSAGCTDVMNHGNPVNGQYVFRVDSWKPKPSVESEQCRKPYGWFIRDFDWSKTNYQYDICK